MKHYAGILFDFDYTLADSSAGVYACVNHALTALGFAQVKKSRSDRTIGLSLADTFRELTGLLAVVQAERFAKYFLEKADAVMVDMTYILPGVIKAIPILAEQGLALGIVSTKRHDPIESILKRADLHNYFSVIVGGDNVEYTKPDPQGVHLALSAMDLPPETVLYVGDSRTDGMTARNAGLDFAAVLTGVTGREVFTGAIGVYRDVKELANMLNQAG